jgi:hypothetical protein
MKIEKDPLWIEIEIRPTNQSKKKAFLMFDIVNEKLYCDVTIFPATMMLCAMCDGIPFLQSEVGARKGNKRFFVNIDWIIEEWGGPKDIVEATIQRKAIEFEQLTHYREKYGAL